MRLLGMEFPAAIFDVSMLILIIWGAYAYLVKWAGDLISFRLWYSESSIWSNFGTNMKIDKTFISGGIDVLKAFNEYQRNKMSDQEFSSLPDDKRLLFENFQLNVELYGNRLGHAGKKFKTVSAFGQFYIWIQGFVLPIGLSILGIYMLIKYGTFTLPMQV